MNKTLPQSEKQYLTRSGDVLDRICWEYYGTTEIATEATLRRNRFISRYPLVLPAGLIITLPVLGNALLSGVELWDYDLLPRSSDGLVTERPVDREAAARAALAAWRLGRRVSLLPGGAGGEDGDGGAVDTPEELQSAEWLAVYYTDALGRWRTARIHKDNLNISATDAALEARVKSLEEFSRQFHLMQFLPEGAASLQVEDGVIRMVFDPEKFQSDQENIEAKLRAVMPQYTLRTCEGDVQVVGPIPMNYK